MRGRAEPAGTNNGRRAAHLEFFVVALVRGALEVDEVICPEQARQNGTRLNPLPGPVLRRDILARALRARGGTTQRATKGASDVHECAGAMFMQHMGCKKKRHTMDNRWSRMTVSESAADDAPKKYKNLAGSPAGSLSDMSLVRMLPPSSRGILGRLARTVSRTVHLITRSAGKDPCLQ